jgi:hypothetical protein
MMIEVFDYVFFVFHRTKIHKKNYPPNIFEKKLSYNSHSNLNSTFKVTRVNHSLQWCSQ